MGKESKMAKRGQKKIDDRIERAFNASCKGVQINIMDIGKVFEVGRLAVAEGADDAMLAAKIRGFVDTIKVA
jgi:hypothetical protein